MAGDRDSPDEAARALLAGGATPIAAIKAVRERFAIGLREAKVVVHRNLSPERRAEAEALWDEAEAAAELDE